MDRSTPTIADQGVLVGSAPAGIPQVRCRPRPRV